MPDFLQKSISLQKSIFLRLTLIWKCNFWGTRVKCVIIKWFNNLLSETVDASFNSLLIIKWNGLISFILSRKFGANFEGASLTYLTSGHCPFPFDKITTSSHKSPQFEGTVAFGQPEFTILLGKRPTLIFVTGKSRTLYNTPLRTSFYHHNHFVTSQAPFHCMSHYFK